MAMVVYGSYRVSDEHVRNALERIADELGRVVRVTSGDRGNVPKGGSSKSLHLSHQAADFHCDGLRDEEAFGLMRMKRKDIFGSSIDLAFRFQIILHGSYTETQGSHLHLGWVPEGREGYYRGFVIEGLTPATKGVYTRVGMP